jgi:hypothetical protein
MIFAFEEQIDSSVSNVFFQIIFVSPLNNTELSISLENEIVQMKTLKLESKLKPLCHFAIKY